MGKPKMAPLRNLNKGRLVVSLLKKQLTNYFVRWLGDWQSFKLIRLMSLMTNKLDGVGPVDNRPSTNKLHHWVEKNTKINTQ